MITICDNSKDFDCLTFAIVLANQQARSSRISPLKFLQKTTNMCTNSCEVRVNSPNVTYNDDEILAKYIYETTTTEIKEQNCKKVYIATPIKREYTFKTKTKIPKVGLMLVGIGGCNGTTVVGGILANKLGITWHSRQGIRKPDWYGSVTMASTVRLGSDSNGNDVYVPMNKLLPMVDPTQIAITGWDINKRNLAEAMERAQVFDYDLIRQLKPHMKDMIPLPGIYFPDFIAPNQKERADNILTGTKQEQMEKIRSDIRKFKEENGLDKVIVLWTATTERYCEVQKGVNDTADALLNSIKNGAAEISPSTVFAVASILEGCSYINGSPQNTLLPGVIELAQRNKVYIAGDDFKTGQTKIKSVLVDFLVSAGLKPKSIVSYNHLGNNDGMNLSAPLQFKSKEISKSNVIDDMIESNKILYGPNEQVDHVVVIKYVPYVGDSKRAMDEYTSEIFMGGKNTIVMHNTCEDSLLAAPVIIDLFIFMELMQRIQWKTDDMKEFENFDPILSILGFLLKAPMVPKGTPVVNALFKQRECIVNFLRACIGLPPENYMLLEHKAIKH